MSPEPVPQADLERIVASARRLGVELDEADALQWLAAVAASVTSRSLTCRALARRSSSNAI